MEVEQQEQYEIDTAAKTALWGNIPAVKVHQQKEIPDELVIDQKVTVVRSESGVDVARSELVDGDMDTEAELLYGITATPPNSRADEDAEVELPYDETATPPSDDPYAELPYDVTATPMNPLADDSEQTDLCSAIDQHHISVRESIKSIMLQRVARSDAHFKHQQRGEPDLTFAEKFDIAKTMLDSNPVQFLARFGMYLEVQDLEYFRNSKEYDTYEVQFYLQQIRNSKDTTGQKQCAKNRRYEAMKQMVAKGDYFSEEKMKFRDPYLYEKLVGQYLTDDEIGEKVDKTDLRFSTILFKHMDQIEENARYYILKETEECQKEEEDEDSDEEEEEMEDDEEDWDKADEKEKKTISPEKKVELKAEFQRIMQERFLQGDDWEFDYSTVDNNEDYDDLDVLGQDAEEKYFDEEEPETIATSTSADITDDTMAT